jgi:hypothetical protein
VPPHYKQQSANPVQGNNSSLLWGSWKTNEHTLAGKQMQGMLTLKWVVHIETTVFLSLLFNDADSGKAI